MCLPESGYPYKMLTGMWPHNSPIAVESHDADNEYYGQMGYRGHRRHGTIKIQRHGDPQEGI